MYKMQPGTWNLLSNAVDGQVHFHSFDTPPQVDVFAYRSVKIREEVAGEGEVVSLPLQLTVGLANIFMFFDDDPFCPVGVQGGEGWLMLWWGDQKKKKDQQEEKKAEAERKKKEKKRKKSGREGDKALQEDKTPEVVDDSW